MSLYQVKIKGTYLGQNWLNRFYYDNANDDGDAETLNVELLLDVIPAMRGIMHSGASFTELETIALDDPFDYSTSGLDQVGSVGGEGLPAFVTSTFSLIPGRRDIRRGRKAFAAVSELVIADGGQLTASFVPQYNAMIVALKKQLVGGLGTTAPGSLYTPALYRPPLDGDPPILAPVTDVIFRWFSTQNSRKP